MVAARRLSVASAKAAANIYASVRELTSMHHLETFEFHYPRTVYGA